VSGCTVNNNYEYGIYVGNYCTVKGCTASGNTGGPGIYVGGSGSQIAGNTCSGNNTGIEINGAQNRIDNNITVNNATYGIYDVSGANVGNNITRNSAPGNSSGGYFGNSGNTDFGPVQTPSTATSPWANF
jgi:parallel beta-helix repeat protein